MVWDIKGMVTTGQRLARTSGFRNAFFNKGMTAVSLKLRGVFAYWKERLMILIITGSKMCKHSLAMKVGTGSRQHDVDTDAVMIF